MLDHSSVHACPGVGVVLWWVATVHPVWCGDHGCDLGPLRVFPVLWGKWWKHFPGVSLQPGNTFPIEPHPWLTSVNGLEHLEVTVTCHILLKKTICLNYLICRVLAVKNPSRPIVMRTRSSKDTGEIIINPNKQNWKLLGGSCGLVGGVIISSQGHPWASSWSVINPIKPNLICFINIWLIYQYGKYCTLKKEVG